MKRISRLLDGLFLLVLAAYIIAGTPLTPFHADEATQIHMSRDFAYQFLQGDYDRLRYDPAALLTAETQLRLINGTINKYTIGLAWWLAGYTTDDLNSDWDWGGDWDYNVSSGRLPSAGVLNAARLPSALFTAAGMVVMFALGWQLGGRPTAWLAALLYALHPALLLNGRRAMMEGSLTFFSLLSVLAALWFAKRRSWAAALALGIAGGLTVASKHTGAATVAAVFTACGVEIAGRGAALFLKQTPHKASLLLDGARLLVAGVVVIGAFFLLNPAWWGNDPVQIGRTILGWREELIRGQAADHQGYRDDNERLLGFAQLSFDAAPQYYEVTGWRSIEPIQQQIIMYEASPWRGINIGGNIPGALLMTVLLAAGIFALLRDPGISHSVRIIVGLWAVAMMMIAWLSPLAWQRYYLPVYPVIALLAAHAPVGVWRWWRALRAKAADEVQI